MDLMFASYCFKADFIALFFLKNVNPLYVKHNIPYLQIGY